MFPSVRRIKSYVILDLIRRTQRPLVQQFLQEEPLKRLLSPHIQGKRGHAVAVDALNLLLSCNILKEKPRMIRKESQYEQLKLNHGFNSNNLPEVHIARFQAMEYSPLRINRII